MDLSYLADKAADLILDPDLLLTTEQVEALEAIYALGSKLRD
jgi:hypothetical protein